MAKKHKKTVNPAAAAALSRFIDTLEGADSVKLEFHGTKLMLDGKPSSSDEEGYKKLALLHEEVEVKRPEINVATGHYETKIKKMSGEEVAKMIEESYKLSRKLDNGEAIPLPE